MSSAYFVGIDVGTTAVKAGVISADGQLVDTYSSPYETAQPAPGWMEQQPDDWCSRIDEALRQFSGRDFAGKIKAVGICSQVNTHVFVDKAGVPLMPAILWSDVRAGEVAALLDSSVTDQQKLTWWGAPMPIDASHALSRMSWVVKHRPDLWKMTSYVLQPKDVCLHHLTGRFTCDPLSSIGLVDANLSPIRGALDLVPGALDRLPEIVDLTDVVGEISPHRPLAGVPVIAGTMDAWCGLLGAGGHSEGATVYLGGTSEILGITSAKLNATDGVIVFPQSQSLQVHATPTQCGGAAKAWFCCQFNMNATAMAACVEAVECDAAVPLFLPQLQGERAPLWNPDLRGAFLGMSQRTGTPQLARAVYEGVAFSARHALAALENSAQVCNESISVGGGGFKSDIWNQIRADILGRTLKRLHVQDPGVVGAAGLAAFALGGYDTLHDVFSTMIRHDRTYEPDSRQHAYYEHRYQLYLDALHSNADWNRRFVALGSASISARP